MLKLHGWFLTMEPRWRGLCSSAFLQLSDLSKLDCRLYHLGPTASPLRTVGKAGNLLSNPKHIRLPGKVPLHSYPASPQLEGPIGSRATVPGCLPPQSAAPLGCPDPFSVVRYAFQILNGSPCLVLIDSENPVFKAKVQALKVSDQRPALVINHGGTGHTLESECGVQ